MRPAGRRHGRPCETDTAEPKKTPTREGEDIAGVLVLPPLLLAAALLLGAARDRV